MSALYFVVDMLQLCDICLQVCALCLHACKICCLPQLTPTMLCVLCSTWSWRTKYMQDGTAMQLCYTSSLSYLVFWE